MRGEIEKFEELDNIEPNNFPIGFTYDLFKQQLTDPEIFKNKIKDY